jgi:hypothetical protein
MSLLGDNSKGVNKNKTDDSQTVAKPITQSEDFVAELMEGAMDFSSIENEQFIVAVNTGNRNKQQLLASTIRGPFDFYEMVEAVGCMYEREAHHAKVYVLTKDFGKAPSFLDEGTIDYLEANWEDIVATGILEAALTDEDDTVPLIPAGLIVTNEEDNDE